MKSRNKQRREQKRKRHKHPELGRPKTAPRSVSHGKTGVHNKKPVVCEKCNQIPKNHLFIGGNLIKNICKCNEYLLEKETERILEKQRQKELNKPIKPGQVRTIYLNKETK